MKALRVLGTGCPSCTTLAERTEEAAKALGIEYTLEKIGDIDEILVYGVMTTPALVIDDEVKITGHVPTLEELKKILSPT